MWLERGYHDVVVHYLEVAGSANLRLSWDGGVPNTVGVALNSLLFSVLQAGQQDSRKHGSRHSFELSCVLQAQLVTIPSSNIFLVRPSTPVPVQAVINGAPARLACNASAALTISDTTTPAAPVDPDEPRTLPRMAAECAYFASSWLTPVITATSVIPGPGANMAGGTLQLNGSLLTNSSSDITILIGDVECLVQSVSADGGSVTCLLPDMTAGPADVTVTVAGAGAASMPAGGATLPMVVPLSVSRSVVPARAAFFGGVELTVSGSGFGVFEASGNSSSACGGSIRCSSTSMVVAVTGAAPGPAVPVLMSSSFNQTIIRLPRFVATSTAATFQLSLLLRVVGTATNTTISTATVPLTLDRAFTPAVTAISPRALQPHTPANLTVSWALPAAAAAAAGLLNATAPGTASLAEVALQAPGSDQAFPCVGAVVQSGNLTSSQFAETLTCAASPDMPAGLYSLWACLPVVGCGYFAAAVQVNASVASISAAAGSTAGGTKIVITGTGGSSKSLSRRAADCSMLRPVCMLEGHHHDLLSLLPQASQPGQQRCRCSSIAAHAGCWTAHPAAIPASPRAFKRAWWLARHTRLLWHPLRCVCSTLIAATLLHIPLSNLTCML